MSHCVIPSYIANIIMSNCVIPSYIANIIMSHCVIPSYIANTITGYCVIPSCIAWSYLRCEDSIHKTLTAASVRQQDATSTSLTR